MTPSRAFLSNLARLVIAVVLLSHAMLVFSGCRSGGESDLVARELRMQEDQLYAMEDYLTQYQQLLRKCRAQNAALKCQLDEHGEELPEPPLRARQPNGARPPARPTPPALDSPMPPETDETPATSPENIQLPDVPPLEETSEIESASPDAETLGEDPHLLAASVESDHDGVENVEAIEIEAAEEPHTVDTEQDSAVVVNAPPESAGLLTQILLRGELMASDAGGGTRLIVEVVPYSDAAPQSLIGGLSLMLLAPSEAGQPHSLARWDFSAEDAQAAANESDDGLTMRFYLQLPADTSADAPLQLWARLLPEHGEKLLAYAEIDFQEPGQFSSIVEPAGLAVAAEQDLALTTIDQSDPNPVQENPVRVASADQAEPRRAICVDVTDGSWNVARAGEAQQLAHSDDELSGTWRMASEPLPTVAMNAGRKEVSHRLPRPYPAARVEQATYAEIKKPSPQRRFEVPTWTPERAGRATASGTHRSTRTAAIPSWSPDR